MIHIKGDWYIKSDDKQLMLIHKSISKNAKETESVVAYGTEIPEILTILLRKESLQIAKKDVELSEALLEFKKAKTELQELLQPLEAKVMAIRNEKKVKPNEDWLD